MSVQSTFWFNGTVVDAVSQATSRQLLFVACIVSGADADEKAVQRVLGDQQVQELLAQHCLCVRLVRGTTDEAMFTQLFANTETPCIYIVRSDADKVALSGGDIDERRVVGEIQSRVGATHEAHPVPQQPRIAKEKQADAVLRKKILEDIRRDRINTEALHARPSSSTTPLHQSTADAAATPPARKEGKAKVLFRISDGRAEHHEFDAAAEFGEVRAFVAELVGVPSERVEIAEAFPRRVLHPDADGAKLCDLGLVPSGTLLVRPWGSRGWSSTASHRGPVSWPAYMYAALVSFFAALLAWLPGRGAAESTPAQSEQQPSDRVSGRSTGRLGGQASDSKGLSQRRAARESGGDGGSDDGGSSDKHTATYNGNSTNLE
ncbi:hypothetical protein GQ54DRAFT_77424 [Martensiomyces pterosporus]|nr:hypothetical protein GQ54DRAFT_77424 [Martensiomyces pterosporus]